jgi:hypothetical protein
MQRPVPTLAARDFDALVRKLYVRHGLSTDARHLHPGTVAERQAIQRLYDIRNDHRRNRFVATLKTSA